MYRDFHKIVFGDGSFVYAYAEYDGEGWHMILDDFRRDLRPNWGQVDTELIDNEPFAVNLKTGEKARIPVNRG